MTLMSRVVIGSMLVLAWPLAYAADGQKIFTQGGANPAAMACLAVMARTARVSPLPVSRDWRACRPAT